MAVKLWQIPGHDVYTGSVDVKWWDGAGWQPVASQSVPGFGNEEITINFGRVLTEQLRLDMYLHEKARDIACVGAHEIEIIGCSASFSHAHTDGDFASRSSHKSALKCWSVHLSKLTWMEVPQGFLTGLLSSTSGFV